jgi:competence ComEA-like helix-hairpin-helix protein
VPATPSQLRGLMVLLGILIIILAIRLALNSKTIPEFKPGQTPASDQLADHIDPNTASEAELAAIPELGEKRAQAIVDFRERFQSRHPNQFAFARLSDLEQISGIGNATAETMGPYLMFPEASATRP